MANDCYPGHYWFMEQDEEGNFLDHDGNIIYTWMDWTQHLGSAIDDQMCTVQHELEDAIAAAVAGVPAQTPPTEAEVITALGAPAAAISPESGAGIATVTILGLTVLAASSADVINNLRTRVTELEDRLQDLGLLA